MKKKTNHRRLAAACTTIAILSAGAASAQQSNWYADFGLGSNLMSEQEFSVDTNNLSAAETAWGFKPGYATKVAVGRRFGSHLRGEVELAHRSNHTEDFYESQFGSGPLDLIARVKSTTAMVNVLYDFPVRENTSIYAGGGVGAALIDIHGERGPNGGLGFVLSDARDTRFAYQARIGVEHKFSSAPVMFLEYTYLGTVGPDFAGFNSGLGDADQFLDYSSHTVMAGIRIGF